MNKPSIERGIKEILVEIMERPISPDEIGEDEVLFPQGVDAVTPIEIAQALEKVFGISVEDEDLREERFESVRTLAEYVQEKLGASSGPFYNSV